VDAVPQHNAAIRPEAGAQVQNNFLGVNLPGYVDFVGRCLYQFQNLNFESQQSDLMSL
jgi:hypothetical protein